MRKHLYHIKATPFNNFDQLYMVDIVIFAPKIIDQE